MSFDTPSANAVWADDEGFPYELWSDEQRELALHYGAASSENQALASRVTKVLDAQGILVLEYVQNVAVGSHPGQVLSDVQVIFGEQSP